MSKPGKTGISRVIDAFGYSMQGFKAAWLFEAAFRQEVILALVMTPLAFWLAQSHIELILLLMSLVLVIMSELINSAIEAVVDRVGSEQHALAGRAKDIGSAVVFVSLVLVGIVWGIIAYQRFIG